MPDTPDTAVDATILAFDFGLRRIGVAVGQTVTGSASPLATVANRDGGPDWQAITQLVAEWRPARIVVGLPVRGDGDDSPMTTATRAFIGDLARFGLPVEAVDERYSSHEARGRLVAQRRRGLRGRLRKGMIDAGSAVIIAERWLAREV